MFSSLYKNTTPENWIFRQFDQKFLLWLNWKKSQSFWLTTKCIMRSKLHLSSISQLWKTLAAFLGPKCVIKFHLSLKNLAFFNFVSSFFVDEKVSAAKRYSLVKYNLVGLIILTRQSATATIGIFCCIFHFCKEGF